MTMKDSSTRMILYVLAAFVLFAVGFIGINLFQDAQFNDAREQPVPSLPAIK